MVKDDALRSNFTSTTGGVMTEEAGAITGELEVSTKVNGGELEADIRYAGADEWYTVEGSPVPIREAENLAPEELHERVVEQLTTPGSTVDGNEQAVSLKNFSTT